MPASTFFDRAKVGVTAAPGTGAASLGNAVAGFQTFDQAGVPDQATVSYVIEDGGNAWEVGQGVYTKSGASLARTPRASSAGTGGINASAAAVVYITALAADLAALGTAGAAAAAAANSTAPTLVQHAQNETQSAGANQPSASGTVTLGAAPTVGNLLVALVMRDGSITASSGWNIVSQKSGAAGLTKAILTRVVTSSDTTATTPINPSDSSVVQVYEVSGYNTADEDGSTIPLLSNTESAVSGGGTFSGTIKAALAKSLILGMAATSNSVTPTITSTVTQDESSHGYINTYFSVQAFHLPVPSAGDVTVSATLGNGSSDSNAATMLMLSLGPKANSSSSTSTSTGGSTSTSTSSRFPAFAPPKMADYSVALNDGTALSMLDDADVGLYYFISGQPPSGDRARVQTRAIAATGDWSFTARVKANIPQHNYHNAGLALYRAGQSYVTHFGFAGASNLTSYNLIINRFNQSGTGYQDAQQSTNASGLGLEAFLQISYVQSTDTLTFAWSKNGKHFITFFTTTGASLCGGAPDHIGFGLFPNNADNINWGEQGATVDYLLTTAF